MLTPWLWAGTLVAGLVLNDEADVGPVVQAQTLREALPADTLAYLAFPDLATTAKEYRAAAIYRMFQNENVRKAVAPLFDVNGPIQEILDELPVPLKLEELTALDFRRLEVALTHIAPAGRHSEPGAEDEPDFGLVIDVQIGESREAWDRVVAWFEEVIEKVAGPLPAGRPSELTVSGIPVEFHGGERGVYIASLAEGRTVLAFSRRTIELVLARMVNGTGELARDEAFERSFSRVTRAGDDVQLWVSLGGFVEVGRAFAQEEPDEEAQKTYDRIMTALGLDEAESLAWVNRLVDGHVETDSVLVGGRSRRGLFSLLPEKNITSDAWKYVPKDALYMGHASLGLKNLIGVIRDVGRAVDYDLIDEDLEEFHENTGFDLEQDLVAKLTGEVLYYQTAPTGLVPVPGTVVLIGLNDASVLLAHAEDILTEIEPRARLSRTRFRDTEIHVLSMSEEPLPIQPAWAVVDGYVVFSAHSQDIKSLLRRRDDRTRSILTSERFQSSIAQAKVPEQYATMSYYDIPALFELLFTTGYQVLGLLGDTGALDVAQLPTADDLSVFLSGSASYSVYQPGVWELHGRSSIGADFYAGALFGVAFLAEGARSPGMLPTDSIEMTRARLAQTRMLLDVYEEQQGRYPASLDVLGEADPTSAFLVDAWGRELVYRIEEGEVVLYSRGPNGEDEGGLGDDVR